MNGSAEFSADRLHRHRLDRWWAEGQRVLVCMANPSRAGADENDQTISTLIAIIRGWGYPGFTVINASDRIATDPREHAAWLSGMRWNSPGALNQIHHANLGRIRLLTENAPMRLLAWGNLVDDHRDNVAVLAALSSDGRYPLYSLGRTTSGAPTHPAARGKHRLPRDVKPIIWREAKAI